ncbi:coiled-coil domain-containing protein 9 isoform X3 [Denticeps clupeoides]|uniref:coiled-coil domain-containing protein 9 isoform X3 n=1 Tax=Denticeps clupeoides TaxID=299321 RepID=UPI0010A3C96B|nr:coiled-coil domain-containing protein 9 isoform X3 [Denticeps clupeoides]
MSTVVDLKTKEEKDAELDRRIEALRKKNEALVRRYQEIEEDKKKAEQEGIAVTTPRKPRNHADAVGDRRKTEKENFTVTVDLSKTTGEKRVVNDRKTGHHVERGSEENEGGSPPRRNGSGRLSRGGQRDGVPRPERRELRSDKGDTRPDRIQKDGEGEEGPARGERTPRGGRRGRGGATPQGSSGDRRSKEWEEKRRQNIEKMNEEMEKIAEYERGQRAEGEKNPTRNFLDDPRRCGPIPEIDRKEGSRRHVRNWGGLDFDNVKTGAEVEKEWTQVRRPGGRGSMDMTLSMTGRERAEYLRWKKEREQIDEERLARHRNATGQWKREWDAQKTETMFKEDPSGLGGAVAEQSSRRGARGRSARAPQRSGATDEGKQPPKAPIFGDFLGQGKPKEKHQGVRAKGRSQGKSYSMHDNRWETEKEEKGKKEENETEKKEEPVKALEEKVDVTEKSKDKAVADEDEDEWEDASEEEAEVGEEEGESESEQKSPSTSQHEASTTSPKEQRTPRPKVHIPPSQDSPEAGKPLSPFSPLEGHQPVTDWGEEMEMQSPRSSLGESPLKPNSTEGSPAQAKVHKDRVPPPSQPALVPEEQAEEQTVVENEKEKEHPASECPEPATIPADSNADLVPDIQVQDFSEIKEDGASVTSTEQPESQGGPESEAQTGTGVDTSEQSSSAHGITSDLQG